jgi:hypothetical protein
MVLSATFVSLMGAPQPLVCEDSWYKLHPEEIDVKHVFLETHTELLASMWASAFEALLSSTFSEFFKARQYLLDLPDDMAMTAHP